MTTDPPLLSLITITRNNLAGLQTTTQSVLAQSFKDFEWIVIDGDSSDGTKDFIKTLFALAVSEADTGIYDAMNKGLDRAGGRYVWFLNAGDRLSDPDILTLVARHLKHDASDFVYGDSMENIDGRFHVKKARRLSLPLGMFTHHQAMIYARQALGGLRFDTSYQIAGDYDLTLRFLQTGRSISYIPAPLCLFESGGLSQTNTTLGRREQMRSKIQNGLCHPVTAKIIYGLQAGNMALRRIVPRFYWLLKRL